MFQGQSFQPMAGPGFLPPVRMAGYRPAAVRPVARGPYMGLSLEDGKRMYDDAKAEIAKFDQLAYQASRIAYKPERDSIVSEFGLLEPDNNDKALNQRNDLQQYVVEVEKSTPPNYYVFIQDTTRPRHRLDRVKSANVALARAVDEAVRTYGLLEQPQVIIKEIQVPGAATPGGGSDLTVPILIGAGAVTLALIFG